MHVYAFSLCLGGAGLVAMAAAGLHAQTHAGGHAHGAGQHAHGAARGSVQGARGATGLRGAVGARGQGKVGLPRGRGAEGWIWQVLSPRVAFSVLVGFGATGLMARAYLPPVATALLAVLGGVVYEAALIGPFWNFLLRFASKPAQTLESAVMDRATAVSGFDAAGDGLVAIELDGQVVQILGTLCPEDRASGVRVRAGDPLRVEDVDAARNRCTVSRSRA